MGKAIPKTLDSVRPLLLLGAGASTPFGIPTMESFLKDSWKKIDEESIAGSIACRRSLDLFEKIDLEEVMFVLEALSELDREEPLAALFLDKVKAKIHHLALPSPDQIRGQADVARRELRGIIYDKCSSYDAEAASQTYGRLLTSLHAFSRSERIYVATTNYDRIIESLWEGRSDGLHTQSPSLELQTGFFRPTYGNPILDIERGYPEAGSQADGVVHLIKIHGSLGWREYQPGRVEDTGAREFAEDAVLAYPVRTDKSRELPFSELFKAFDSALAEANLAVIIGISLRDEAIVERLAEALRPGNMLAVVLDPEPEEVRNKLPSGVRKYVLPKNGYFGPGEIELSSEDEWSALLGQALKQLTDGN